ncbi:MAG: hypothetical protein WCS89_00355 [Candidatus Paceibacterota bacterium]|jgi:hypothetical protein
MKNRWKILIATSIVIAILALGLKMYFDSSFNKWVRGPNKKTVTTDSNQAIEQPSEKIITLNDYEWQGMSCFDPQKKIKGNMVTRGVWWQVRFDQRDDQIYDLYPTDWNKNSYMRFPDSNINEWRVKPGQSIKKATLVAQILPRDN